MSTPATGRSLHSSLALPKQAERVCANPKEWTDTEFVRWADYRKAVSRDDLGLLKKLVGEGLKVNSQWSSFSEQRDLVVEQKRTWYHLEAKRCGSPLHEAARKGSAEFVQLLISSGADINLPSLDGSTALHESVSVTNNKVTTLLVDEGIDVNRRILTDFPYGDDLSALQIASKKKDLESVRFLLNNGAQPDSRCVDNTLENHDFQMLQLLLSYGGVLDLASSSTHNAYTRAKWKGQRALQTVLSGQSPVTKFVQLDSAKLGSMINETDRPFGILIDGLRIFLDTWLNQQPPVFGYELCCHCENVTSSELPYPSDDATSIKLNSCPLCRIIYDERLPYREKTNVENRGQMINVTFSKERLPHIKTKGELSFGYPRGQLARILSRLGSCVDSSTEGEGTMALARAWLLNCLVDHEECSASPTTLSDLPTRVIDVGSSLREPSLFVSNNKPGTYCALSYCWGRHPFLRTTKATLAKHQESVPMRNLPKTLREAILVARQLSIQYIWIDALCIVQDDLDDWAREAASMASIYRNAVLTIVAAAADDTTKGLFQVKTRNRVWPVKIPDHLSKRSRERANTSYSERWWNLSSDFWGTGKYSPQDPSSPQDDFYVFAEFSDRGKGPIDHRAWCTQEYFLSSRVLFFSHELYWECRHCVASEARPGGAPSGSVATQLLRRSSLNDESRVADETMLDEILTGWEEVLENYTKRQITMQSDRLVALSGMASVVGRLVGCEFFAGLWRGKHLCRSLLWQVTIWEAEGEDMLHESPEPRSHGKFDKQNSDSMQRQQRPKDGQSLFPSWCWASCLSDSRQVTYNRWDEYMKANKQSSRTPNEVAEVISSRVDDIFTPNLIQGTITLRGRLRQMKVVKDEHIATTSEMASNFVRIMPAIEPMEYSDVEVLKREIEDDYQLSESPPTEWTMPYNVIDEAAPKEWLEQLNKGLDEKLQKRSGASKTLGLSSGDAFGSDLMARLQGLEELKVQQDANKRVPVPVEKRKHFWIKDHASLPNEEIWCFPISFWEEVMVGLCLEPTTNTENEFRRIGLCNIERSGNQAWEEDVVFDSWMTLEKVTVSIV